MHLPECFRNPDGASWRESARVGCSLCLATLVLAATGCGGDGRLDVYPVSGLVTFKGKPAEGAKLIFFGQDERLRAAGVPVPEATTDAAGAFELTTYDKGDGAPEGSYGVAISWMETVTASDDPEARVERDRLGGRYANYEKSGLTATIAAGDNDLPTFELK